MARYEHLPIYKKAMDVAVHFEKVVAGFSRYHKYTLGTELRNKSREIVSLIVKANSTKDKLPCLLELRERVEELIILVRLCKEVRAFKSFKSFQFAIEQVILVSRQNEGWIKSAGKKRGWPESSKRQEGVPSSFG
jgi:hypothetical protein